LIESGRRWRSTAASCDLCSGFSDITQQALHHWITRFNSSLEYPSPLNLPQKTFKPKCDLPKQWQYSKLSDKFWSRFPQNLRRVAEPNISHMKLRQIASAVGVSDKARLKREIYGDTKRRNEISQLAALGGEFICQCNSEQYLQYLLFTGKITYRINRSDKVWRDADKKDYWFKFICS